jgi:TatD DNase family protein
MSSNIASDSQPAKTAKPSKPAQPVKASKAPAQSKEIIPVHVGGELVDIGVNLCDKRYQKDFATVLQRAQSGGVTRQIITGTSLDGSREGIALAQQHPGALWSTVGVHPHDSARALEECNHDMHELIRRLEQMMTDNPNQVCAAGEMGLDYDRDFSPRDVQRAVFRAQVELACKLQKPMFLHERSAQDDLFVILDEFRDRLPHVVCHCFTGTEQELDRIVSAGFYVGITGFVAMRERGAALRPLIHKIPLDKLLLETDAPYMAGDYVPEGIELQEAAANLARCLKKSGRNEPCGMALVALTVSECYNISVGQIAEQTTKNALKFFNLA